MNVLEVYKRLKTFFASAGTGEDILRLGKIIEDLEMGSLEVVQSYGELPSNFKEGDIFIGKLYYVLDESLLIWYDGEEWKSNIANFPSNELYSWGTVFSLGGYTSTSSPVTVLNDIKALDWVDVDKGFFHAGAIRSSGELFLWGVNNFGQLGNGVTTSEFTIVYPPVTPITNFTDWVSVSTSEQSTVALRDNGTLWSFGYNYYGQLGDGTTENRSSPVSVLGGFTDWESVSSGGTHTVGIRSNGTLWSFGYNGDGQLGDGLSYTTKSSPVSVIGGFTDWSSVSCGSSHTLGVRDNGTLWGFGSNAFGFIGDGTVVSRSSPVSVIGGFTDWSSVSCGFSHTAGIRSNGTLWTWGLNSFGGYDYGSIGDGTAVSRSSPVSVIGGFTDWSSVSCGNNHTIGLRDNGTLWSFGRNNYGYLGDGTTEDRSSPVSVVGNFTNWISVHNGPFGIKVKTVSED
jgi:alpha-tubulin suppressor-like RCC1 family protein